MPSERDKAIAALTAPGRRHGAPPMDDATARELVEFFLDELDHGVQSIERACSEDDARTVRRIARQFKDAAAGFGFPQITEAAGMLERALLEEEAALSATGEMIEELLRLCRDARC